MYVGVRTNDAIMIVNVIIRIIARNEMHTLRMHPGRKFLSKKKFDLPLDNISNEKLIYEMIKVNSLQIFWTPMCSSFDCKC